MKKPAFQFYPSDWLASMRVTMLTLEQEGAYLRLLCYCWHNGSLPADPSQLAKLVGKEMTAEKLAPVILMFSQDNSEPDRLRHERLDAERSKQAEWARKSALGGKTSAKRRANKPPAEPVVQPPLPLACNQSVTLQLASATSTSFTHKTESRVASALRAADQKALSTILKTLSPSKIEEEIERAERWLSVNPRKQIDPQWALDWMARSYNAKPQARETRPTAQKGGEEKW